MEIGKFGIFLGANTQQFDKALRRSQKKMGGFGKSANKLGRTVAGMFGAFSAAYVIRDAFNTIKDFEQANADLASVLGTTRSGVSALTADAERLGASTAFTATEVAQLQKEFAKLGFSQAQILDTTEATLNLAAATGTDLARAAEVAGSTVNAFGLKASETGHITDVMAKSFSSTALDMEAFAETMKLAGPIAKNTGVSLEQATSAAGALANAGIKGSLAGTALKNIFSELIKDGKPLEESLRDIKAQLDGASTDAEKLAIAEGLVGERSKAALLILTDQIDTLDTLTTSFSNADGAAKDMADTQLDTLGGSLKILSSAWDGFILSLNSGEGEISKFFKGAVDLVTNFISKMALANKSVRDIKLEVADSALRDAIRQDLEDVENLTEKYAKIFDVPEQEAQLKALQDTIASYESLLSSNPDSELVKGQLDNLRSTLDALKLQIDASSLSESVATTTPNTSSNRISIAPISSTAVGSDLQLGNGMDATLGTYDAVSDKTDELIDKNSLLMGSFTDLAGTMASSLGRGEASWASFGGAMLDATGQIVQGYIKQATAASLMSASDTAAKTPFGLFLLPAFIGLALSFIKGGISKAGSTPTAFADGGIVSGPTLGLVGEYSGARSNPEVIAPLDKLKSLLPSSGPTNMNITGEFKMSGRDMKLVLNNENVRFSRL